jgi:hypothetical protein
VICDNTEQHRAAYADYFAFINDPAQGFRTMTLLLTAAPSRHFNQTDACYRDASGRGRRESPATFGLDSLTF